MTTHSTYTRLMQLLASRGAQYRVLFHEPEGRTEAASAIRGHCLEQAAKCMVVRIKRGNGTIQYALAVIPGDRRVDFKRIKRLLGGSDASMAHPHDAERLADCVVGAIIPFSFNPELRLVVDPVLLEQSELFFNAARLDCSIGLATEDYIAMAEPFIEEPISRRDP
jgi:Ala-tRNA(Pro) deacylase